MPKRKLDSELTSLIQTRFNLSVPSDFFRLFELAQSIAPTDPLSAFNFLGLQLVGPFELLVDHSAVVDAHTHRFWFDPPEVTTVAVAAVACKHYGFFRDSASEIPFGLVEGDKSPKFTMVAATLSGLIKKKLDAFISPKDTEKVQKIKKYLAKLPTSDFREKSAAWEKRAKTLVATTSLGLGVCVPYDAKRQTGYRELPVSKKILWTIFRDIKQKKEADKNRTKLEEVFNWVNIGNDEMDFGQGYELGMELFAADSIQDDNPLAFGKAATIFLTNAYKLLGRQEWVAVLEGAMDKRRREAATLLLR